MPLYRGTHESLDHGPGKEIIFPEITIIYAMIIWLGVINLFSPPLGFE